MAHFPFDLTHIGTGLPVAELESETERALIGGSAVVQAPPGSGKTTFLPPLVANLLAHSPDDVDSVITAPGTATGTATTPGTVTTPVTVSGRWRGSQFRLAAPSASVLARWAVVSSGSRSTGRGRGRRSGRRFPGFVPVSPRRGRPVPSPGSVCRGRWGRRRRSPW